MFNWLKPLAVCLMLSTAFGFGYGIIKEHELRRAIHRADSLQLVSDSLFNKSDSLLAVSKRRDSVFVNVYLPRWHTRWDTVRVDSLVYVPLAQADSVRNQRDACLVVWSSCTTARDSLMKSRDAMAAANAALHERIARDSAKKEGPHLDLSTVIGAGALYSPRSRQVEVGPGVIVGIRLHNIRLF